MIDLLVIGLFGGFYIVPLYALIQIRAAPDRLSRIIAANNILNALFMVVAALLAVALFHAGLNIPQVFVLNAILNALVAIYIFSLVPEFTMRFMSWLIVRSEEHTSELQSLMRSSYAVFCLKKKKYK